MPEKIHCDLMEVYGPDWANLPSENVECLANTIDNLEQLFGDEPKMFGFVGTRRIENIVGGYFAIQYDEEEFHYNKQKELNKLKSSPFVRMFFVFFAQSGKLLLQNTKFVNIPLTMTMAIDKFREALDNVLERCGIRKTFNLALAPENAEDSDFVREFEQSTRVARLEINYPDGQKIPEDFVYYNPQKDRNEIIRESHKHDYPHLKKIDLEATNDGDIKQTHLRDLVYAGSPSLMRYFIDQEEYVMRRVVRRKFEFYIDMDSERIPEEQLKFVLDMLRTERAIYLDLPTGLPTPEADSHQKSPQQLSLFSSSPETQEDEDE